MIWAILDFPCTFVKSHWYPKHETYPAKWQIMFEWDHTHQSHSSCSSSRITFIQCDVIWFLVALRYFVLYFTVCNLFFRNNEIFVHYLYKDIDIDSEFSSCYNYFRSTSQHCKQKPDRRWKNRWNHSSIIFNGRMHVLYEQMYRYFFPHHIFLVSSGMYYVNSVGFSVKVLKP